ncbi:MAG: SUF system NifU family Fe-S cluster assembly protein [Spirochaetia bacterium]|nr:SUF system NifU family Fe-S cluster assembly protein [Spirochaetia bacterium]
MSLDELYREVILDHFEHPRNKGKLDPHDAEEHGSNPLCGDKIDIYLTFGEGDKVKDIRFEGSGCSISQSSISMLTEAIKGKSYSEIQNLIHEFKAMMLENKPNPFSDNEDLEDLGALEGVKKYPVRIKCALLGWNTLDQALSKKFAVLAK